MKSSFLKLQISLTCTTMHAHRLTLDKAATPATSGFGQPSIPKAAAEVGAVLAEAEDAGRSLLQVNTDDFSCVGCPAGGPDTRTEVASTTSFPYSAIGQLMGQVTSNMCALSLALKPGPQHDLCLRQDFVKQDSD